jgi:phage terminase large subunit
VAAASSLFLEKRRRNAVPDLLNACFDRQVAFIRDPSRRKVLFVPRRSGKSWAMSVFLIVSLLSAPDTKCLYYARTKDQAWNILYKHMLQPICRAFGIKYKTNITRRVLEFENGSELTLTGNDATDDQVDKALGGKYKLVVFDECQVIKRDLESWVNDKLGPAMVDLDGIIVLGGTAGELMGEHYWYRVTRPEERVTGWSVHEWTPFDNPYMAEKVRKDLEERRQREPDLDENPGYQREWLNRWVVERDSRVYRYDPIRNWAAAIPDLADNRWRYIMGVDFGYEDDSAIVVGAYHPHDQRCVIVDSFKRKHLDIDPLADEIQDRRARWKPEYIVCDGQAKQVAETLRRRHQIPLHFADKLGKAEHIAAMNNDFRAGKLMVVRRGNEALVKEWDALTWDEKARMRGLFKESPTKDNHLADAALYMHHAAKHYWAKPEAAPDPHPMRTIAEARLRQQMAQRGDALGFYGELEKVG